LHKRAQATERMETHVAGGAYAQVESAPQCLAVDNACKAGAVIDSVFPLTRSDISRRLPDSPRVARVAKHALRHGHACTSCIAPCYSSDQTRQIMQSANCNRVAS
jgi:hypothetical protein